MNELKEKGPLDLPTLRSRIVAVNVETGMDGHARIVLEGPSMGATGFQPGDRVEAIIQPELISILRVE